MKEFSELESIKLIRRLKTELDNGEWNWLLKLHFEYFKNKKVVKFEQK